jgi:hypothetical protein
MNESLSENNLKMNLIENPSSDFERQFVVAINARRKLKGVS